MSCQKETTEREWPAGVVVNERLLVVNRQRVHPIKGFGTRRTLAHAVADSILHAPIAEEVTACLERRILEIVAANRA